MGKINFEYFKEKLEKEKERIEAELSKVAKRNPDHPQDWEPIPDEDGQDRRITDPNELSDAFEEFENRSAIGAHLEERFNDIIAALRRIENKTYGICESCREEINEKRLEANPAAATCVKHSK